MADPDDVVDIFREKLREALERKKMSQAELARRAEVDQSSISRYLAGEVGPNIRQLCALANALELDAADLIECEK